MKRKPENDEEGDLETEPSEKIKKTKVKSDKTTEDSSKNGKSFKFDVKHFRKELKTASNKSATLLQFFNVATKSNNGIDYIKLYLECGGTPAEILSQIDEQDRKNLILGTTVFSLLNVVLLKIQADIPHLLQSCEDTCRFFLNSYVPLTEGMLNEKSNAKQQKVTLKLLSTMVVLNPELGVTILNQLSLQPKMIQHLVKPSTGKDKTDARQSFIHFMLSFLVENNTQLIKGLLEKQGLLNTIIPDLVKDKSEIILMVIQQLKNSVIKNSNISKTLKIRTFTHYTISCLFNLFNWKGGLMNAQKSFSQEQKDEIENSVSELLEILFTSHKYGIYFSDKFLGTGETLSNQYLWKVFESLETPWNNSGVRKLLLTIIKKCPDLFPPLKKSIEEAYDTSNPKNCIATLIFMRDIITEVSESKIVDSLKEMNLEQMFTFLKNMYASATLIKISNETINTADVTLKNEVCLLLHTTLDIIKLYCIKTDMDDIHNIKQKSILKTRFQEIISKKFPSTDTLIMIMHKILDQVSSAKGEKIDSDDELKKSQLLITILNLLLSLDDMVPHSLDPVSAMLDSKRLFEKLECFHENKIELKLKTTLFLLRADKFAFAPSKPLFKEVLTAVLEVFIFQDVNMIEEAKFVLYNILDISEIFESNSIEIDVLLYVINSVKKVFGGDTFKMIIDLLENILLNKEKYKKIHSTFLVGENKKNLCNNFDEVFENILNYDSSKDNYFVIESASPSFFMTGLIQCTNNLNAIHPSINLLNEQFFVNLLHFQDNPEAMWNILKQSNITENTKKYVLAWETNPVYINKNVYGKSDILTKLSKGILKNESIDTSLLSDYDFKNELFDFNIIFNMTLFYTLQQHRLKVLDENKLTNALKTFEILIQNCILDNEPKIKNYINVIGKCLSSKLLQEEFSPLVKNKDDEKPLLTCLVLHVMEQCNNKNIALKTLETCYKPYKQRLNSLLISEIKSSKNNKKGVKFDNLVYLFSLLKFDTTYLNDLTKEIISLNTKCLATDVNETSSWIQIICCTLSAHNEAGTPLAYDTFVKIMQTYVNVVKELEFGMNIVDLEENLYNYISKNPIIVKNLPVYIFEHIFSIKHVSKFTSKLLTVLLRVNMNYINKFANIITKDEILDKREFVFPLMSVALENPKMTKSRDILKSVYDHYKPNIIKIIEKPHKATQIYVDNSNLIVKLLLEFMEAKECAKFFHKVVKFETVEEFHIDILEILFFKSSFNNEEKFNAEHLPNFLLCLLQLGVVLFKRDVLITDKLHKLTSLLKKTLNVIKSENSPNMKGLDLISKNTTWKNFFKSALSSLLKPSENSNTREVMECFECICLCIDIFYKCENEDISELYEMVISHSEFLNVMLSTKYCLLKNCLAKLIFLIVHKNKDIMKPAHIPLYLSAFQASLSECDKTIMSIIKYYEDGGISLSEYKPFLWGEAGANHFALRSNRKKASLWSKPTVNHILNLLDRDKIETTLKYFPNQLKLNFEACKIDCERNVVQNFLDDLIKVGKIDKNVPKDDILKYISVKIKMENYAHVIETLNLESLWNEEYNQESEVYDPRFLLPLLNFILAPGSPISCHRVLRCGIMAVPLVALSSSCSMMRAAAYNVLYRFTTQLDSEMYYKNDKLLWTQFMNTLKTSLASIELDEQTTDPNPRLPHICALYLGRAALVMTNPLHPLFKPVNSFVISKQHINFTIVPDFLDLFHNSDILFNERRIWILEILRDGIRTFSDVKLLLKSVVFKMLFDFYSSSLADNAAKLIILEIINKTVCIPKAAKILTENYGLFPWLSSVCCNFSNEMKNLISTAIQICYNITISMVINTSFLIAKLRNNNVSVDLLINDKCLNLNKSLETNILCLLIDLLDKISGTARVNIEIYLNTLRKLSIFSIKLISKEKMSKLTKSCGHTSKSNKKIVEYMLVALEKKKDSSHLLASKMLIELEADETVLEYLYEIITKWLM